MGVWEREWKLNAGSAVISGPPPQESVFELVRHDAQGITFYTVQFGEGRMPASWEGVKLFPQGSTPRAWSNGKLPAWTGTQGPAYSTGIAKHLSLTDSDTERLEGELSSGGAKVKVWLFRAADAVDRPAPNNDLLIVRTRSALPWSNAAAAGGVGPIEDGTGHGN